MESILYATLIAALIFTATYFKDLKNKHRMAKTNRLKAIAIKREK